MAVRMQGQKCQLCSCWLFVARAPVQIALGEIRKKRLVRAGTLHPLAPSPLNGPLYCI